MWCEQEAVVWARTDHFILKSHFLECQHQKLQLRHFINFRNKNFHHFCQFLHCYQKEMFFFCSPQLERQCVLHKTHRITKINKLERFWKLIYRCNILVPQKQQKAENLLQADAAKRTRTAFLHRRRVEVAQCQKPKNINEK